MNDHLLFEITSINKELKRLRKEMGALNVRKKELTNKVIQNLKDNGETEIVYDKVKYTVEEKVTHNRKGNKEKRKATLAILNEEGYFGENADDIYNQITEAMQGSEKVVVKLKS